MIEELANQGIDIRERLVQGRTNNVFLATCDGRQVVCKIYRNKYFPEQRDYEVQILSQLRPFGFSVPEVLLEGLVEGRPYSLLTFIDGRTLFDSVPDTYLPQITRLLHELHDAKVKTDIIHPLQMNPDLVVEKALTKIANSQLSEQYRRLTFKSCKVGFCHRDPNFKHILFADRTLSGIVDFEDAMFLPVEVDYASFLRDQIEIKRPKGEIMQFIQSYGEDPENLTPYLARLYILDLGFKHGLIVKSDEKYIGAILTLLNQQKIDEKIDVLLNDYDN